MSRDNLAIALVLGVPLLVGLALGVVAGANLPYRIAQHAPRPLPALWERMGETPWTTGPEWAVSRNTQQKVYPPPTEELTRVLAYEFFVHFEQEGMSGVTARLQNCFDVYEAIPSVRSRALLMRCTVMDHAVTRFDEIFRANFISPGAAVPPSFYPFLAEETVRARRAYTARILFGGDRKAQALAMAPAVGLIFSELLRFRRSGSGAPGAGPESPESSPRLKTGPATLPG